MKKRHKIVVAITGASGAIYAQILLQKLQNLHNQVDKIGIVMSDNAKIVWEYELNNKKYAQKNFLFFSDKNFHAPFASGSSGYNIMFVCPLFYGNPRANCQWYFG